MNSATVLAGTDGCTTSTLVRSIVPAMGALSRRKSKGSFSYNVALMALFGATNPIVAVRRRTEDGSHSDVAASSNPVFYYYLLAKFLGKELPDDSSDCVIRASRRKRYDPVNWP